MRRTKDHATTIALVVLLAGLLTAAESTAQGVTVALMPTRQEVTPGAVFTLDMTVYYEGSPFNGFDAVIGYDPSALTLLPYSPVSLQEGVLMVGACGNTFHQFQPATGTASITDVLLCNNVALTGPGQLYRLQFQASTTPQVTQVQFLPGLQFYNAGLYVNPAIATDATIGIGVPLGVEGQPGVTKGLQLRVAPNPSRGAVTFTVQADRAGPQRISVFDIRGRLVRRFEGAANASGIRTVAWDGRDTGGHRPAAGVYLVTLEAGGRVASGRVSLIR
jgi:hypothetical protein